MTDETRTSPGVLGTLPASRPERLGGPRAAKPEAAAQRPEAVRPGAAPLRPPRAPRPPVSRLPPPTGAALVTTAVQAAGELAQIGVGAGARALKRAMHRFPRP